MIRVFYLTSLLKTCVCRTESSQQSSALFLSVKSRLKIRSEWVLLLSSNGKTLNSEQEQWCDEWRVFSDVCQMQLTGVCDYWLSQSVSSWVTEHVMKVMMMMMSVRPVKRCVNWQETAAWAHVVVSQTSVNKQRNLWLTWLHPIFSQPVWHMWPCDGLSSARAAAWTEDEISVGVLGSGLIRPLWRCVQDYLDHSVNRVLMWLKDVWLAG